MSGMLKRWCLLLLVLGGTGEIRAQPAPASPTSLGEVVVTATRRAQSLASVPVAVTEINGASLDKGVIRDTQSLIMAVPSLNVSVSGSEASGSTIRIRGVGTTGSNAGFESSVGVFVDGVYIPRPGLALNDLVDIDRIEVLRGPQGTLYGKNTSVGAINILTRMPDWQPEAELSASAGNMNAYITRGIFNAPLTRTLAVRVSAQYDVRDGYIHNLHDGRDYNDRNRYLVRGQALFQPSRAFSVRLIGDLIRKQEHCCAAPYVRYGATPEAQIRSQGGTQLDPPPEYTTAFDFPLYANETEYSGSLHLNWNLGGVQAKGILSYQRGNSHASSDGDYNDLDLIRLPNGTGNLRIETAELSLHGDWGPIDTVGGVFYSFEKENTDGAILFGRDAGQYLIGVVTDSTTLASLLALGGAALYPAGSGQTEITAHQDGRSGSVFLHNIVSLGGGFAATLGVRYLDEAKDGGGHTDSNSPSCLLIPNNGSVPQQLRQARALCGAAPYQANYQDRRFTGTAALSKKFGESTYAYLSYSSGFKAGGINLNPSSTVGAGDALHPQGVTIDTTFRPEKVNSYEAGLTLPLFRKTLSTRTTLFRMDIDDFQINTYDGLTFTVSNAAKVRSQGVEFESIFTGIHRLALRAAATYADAVYTRYQAKTISGATQDLSGRQLTNAPRWTVNAGAEYRLPLPWWDAVLFTDASMRYQSAVNTGSDLDPAKAQGGYALLNGRLGLDLPHGWQLALWGANLTDQYYRMVVFNSPGQTGSYNAYVGLPRTYGIQITKDFWSGD
ncbi:MAG: TonB-dependent receptor [Sinobacteraceae bacterium]|nr:TonB-dependent receptor [Nevskiaceae bacterium]